MLFDYIIPITNIGESDFRDRVSNLQMIINSYPKKQVRIIIVEQIIDSSLETFKSKLNMKSNVQYHQVSNKIFNKSWLYNIGANKSNTGHLILGESDCVPNSPVAYFKSLKEDMINNDRKWAFGWNKLLYLDASGKKIVKTVRPREGFAEGGLVYFRKDYYDKIGGANEFLRELGGIDNELAKRAAFNQRRYSFQWSILHHWHKDSKMKSNNWRFAEYRSANRTIYTNVSRNTALVIKRLSHLNKGQTNPLCETVRWQSIWT